MLVLEIQDSLCREEEELIHDLVVAPEINDESTFEMEKNIITKELERVVDFSTLAMNKPDTYNALEPILSYYNINLYDNINNKNS